MEKGGLIFWYTYKLYPLATLFILEQFCGNYPSLEYYTNFTVVTNTMYLQIITELTCHMTKIILEL